MPVKKKQKRRAKVDSGRKLCGSLGKTQGLYTGFQNLSRTPEEVLGILLDTHFSGTGTKKEPEILDHLAMA